MKTIAPNPCPTCGDLVHTPWGYETRKVYCGRSCELTAYRRRKAARSRALEAACQAALDIVTDAPAGIPPSFAEALEGCAAQLRAALARDGHEANENAEAAA